MGRGSLNKVMLIGRLAAEPELRYTSGGAAIAKLRLAVDDSYKNAAGELVERVEWIGVEFWNKPAEILNQYAEKGQRLYVEGKFVTDTWDDRETGEKKYRSYVKGEEFTLLDKPSGAQGGRYAEPEAEPEARAPRAPAASTARPAATPAGRRAETNRSPGAAAARAARNVPQTVDSDEDLPF